MNENMKEMVILAIQEAGDILMKNFSRKKKIKTKVDGDLVCDSDFQSEKTIIEAIRAQYPDHSIITEERGTFQKKSDYMWIIDPLDGTHNYIHRIPFFGVSIALEYKKEVILGVVYLPYFNELYIAEKGKGAFLDGRKINVSQKYLKESFLVYGNKIVKMRKQEMEPFFNIAKKVFQVRIFGVATIGLTLVATGRAEAYIAHVKPVDVAGGGLILKEAGGIITDWKGNIWNPYVKRIVATNSNIHTEIIEVINAITM